MSFVVQMFRPSTMNAMEKSPSLIMTSKISLPPAYAEATPPKKNIREFPSRNATTVATAPTGPFLAKRVKFGVAVPPETKEPITMPAPLITVRLPELLAN